MIIGEKSISVVLGVYNQREILERTLRIWEKACLSYVEGSELIICDDGSDDGTREFIEDYMDKSEGNGLRIVYIPQENIGKPRLAASLNNSLNYIECPYTMFCMGDSYPGSNVLERYSYFLSPHTILSGLRRGVHGVFNHSTIFPDYRQSDPRYLAIDRDFKPWQVFTGNNFVIPTSMLTAIGGWNEGFEGYGAEDWELAMYAFFKEEAAFRAVPDAVVFHVIHEPRPGSGDPDYYLAKWINQLELRYSSENYDRSTDSLLPRG